MRLLSFLILLRLSWSEEVSLVQTHDLNAFSNALHVDLKDVSVDVKDSFVVKEDLVEDVIPEYFRALQKIDPIHSANVIESVPITYYFDVFGGKFRLGVIGETLHNVADVARELVTSINKKVMMKQKHFIQLQNVQIVDVQTLFMHGIGVIQRIFHNFRDAETHIADIDNTIEWERRQTEHIHTLFDELKDELPIDIKMQKDTIELNTQLQQSIRGREEAKRDSKLEMLQTRLNNRLRLREEQHLRLINATSSHLERMERIKIEGLQMLANAREQFENEKHSKGIADIDKQVSSNIRKLQSEINGIIAATTFRIEEETRLETETEDTARKVMTAQQALETAELEKFIQTIFGELSKAVSFAVGNIEMMLQGAFILLSAVVLLVAVFEAATVARSILFQLSKRQIPMLYVSRNKDLWAWTSLLHKSTGRKQATLRLDDVILNEPLRCRLRLLSEAIAVAVQHHSPLPHLLVRGVGGTGKSITADAIAYDAGLSYATINASEVLALGDKSSLFLFDFLQNIKKGRTPTVVILDQVDEIILQRGEAIDAVGFTESCFYVLLQIMREANPLLSLILTTKLAIRDIDAAITDRIDHIMEMPLPSPEQRLLHVVKSASTLFAPYINTSQLLQLAALKDRKPSTPHHRSDEKGTSANPETDVPSSIVEAAQGRADHEADVVVKTTFMQTQAVELEVALDTMLRQCSSSEDKAFNVKKCLDALVMTSVGWSYRDLDRVLNAVVSAVLGTVECHITTSMFLTQVQHTLKEKKLTETYHH